MKHITDSERTLVANTLIMSNLVQVAIKVLNNVQPKGAALTENETEGSIASILSEAMVRKMKENRNVK